MTKIVQRIILFIIVFCCFLAAKPLSQSRPPVDPALVKPASVNVTADATRDEITMAVPVTKSHSVSSIEPVASAKVSLPEKWENYLDLEQVSRSTKLDIAVPASLPVGFELQKVEHREGITRATYVYEQQRIEFVQHSSKREAAEVWTTDEHNRELLSVAWSWDRREFQLIGENVSKEQLILFKQSLYRVAGEEQGVSLPYQIVEVTGFSDQNGTKERSFKLFSPEKFQSYITKQRLIEKETFQPLEHSIVIGLFSGMKGSSGYSIEVLDIALQGSQLTVTFKESEPSREDNVLAYVTYPSHFVNVALTAGEVASVQFLTEKGQAVAHLPLSEK